MIRLIHSAPAIRKPDLDEEALAWVVKLTSGASSPADHAEFRAWRDLSDQHAAALARARTLWSQLGSALPKIEKSSRPRRNILRRVSLAASLILGLQLGWQYWSTWRFDQVTGLGEHKTVSLSDGSYVVLSGNTAVNLDFSQVTRRVELTRGEAMFTVRHDATRPFVVRVAGSEIRDVGTAFNIATTPAGAQVVVTQGAVETSSNDVRVLVHAGQALTFSANGPDAVQFADTETATAWTRGRLIFDDRQLTDILATIQPHYGRRLLLLNQKVGRQPLSAVIDLQHVDDWLDALAKRKTVRITRLAGLTILS